MTFLCFSQPLKRLESGSELDLDKKEKQQHVRKKSQSTLVEETDKQLFLKAATAEDIETENFMHFLKILKYLHFFFSLQLLPQLPFDTFGRAQKKILNLRLRHTQSL